MTLCWVGAFPWVLVLAHGKTNSCVACWCASGKAPPLKFGVGEKFCYLQCRYPPARAASPAVNTSRVLLLSCFGRIRIRRRFLNCLRLLKKEAQSKWHFITNHRKGKKKKQTAITSLLMMEGWLKSGISYFHSKLSSGSSVRTLARLHSFLLRLRHSKSNFPFPNICHASNVHHHSVSSKDESGIIYVHWAHQNFPLYFKI